MIIQMDLGETVCMQIDDLLKIAMEQRASDLHLKMSATILTCESTASWCR